MTLHLALEASDVAALLGITMFGSAAASKSLHFKDVVTWSLRVVPPSYARPLALTLIFFDVAAVILFTFAETHALRSMLILTASLAILVYQRSAPDARCPCFGRPSQAKTYAASGVAVVLAVLSAPALYIFMIQPDQPLFIAGHWYQPLVLSAPLITLVAAVMIVVSRTMTSSSLNIKKEALTDEIRQLRRDAENLAGKGQGSSLSSIYFGDLRCSSCLLLAKKYVQLSNQFSCSTFGIDLGIPTREGLKLGQSELLTIGRAAQKLLGIKSRPALLVFDEDHFTLYIGLNECGVGFTSLIPVEMEVTP